MLLLGGAAVVNALTGMSTYAYAPRHIECLKSFTMTPHRALEKMRQIVDISKKALCSESQGSVCLVVW